jgi:hypothetical protein
MSVEIVSNDRYAVLICNTSDWAFGPAFCGSDAEEQAECFCDWFSDGEAQLHRESRPAGILSPNDPRSYTAEALERLYNTWQALTADGLYSAHGDGSTDWVWRTPEWKATRVEEIAL